jgi:homoserine kinase
VAATISGAGPTILVLHTGNQQERDEIVKSAGEHFTPFDLDISSRGAEVASV